MSIGVIGVYLPKNDPSNWTAFDQPIVDTNQIFYIDSLEGMKKIKTKVKINDELKDLDVYRVSDTKGWVIWNDFHTPQ
jgi:hypothetical protein